MDLSISIVSYNTKDLLKQCISSIYRYTKGLKFEIIVVDNGSSDRSIEMVQKEFPNVTLIKNKQNLFFTKANNQAFQKATGKYVLILNSDTYFVDNALKKMLDYMEKHTDVSACEGLEIYENGVLVSTGSQFSTPLIDFYELSLIGKRIANKRVIDAYRISNKDRKDTFEIDVGCDAFLLVRKKILDTIKGYDEKLLLYYTENDLCFRIKKTDKKIMHFGEAKVIHKVSASVIKLGWQKTDIYYQDLLWYYQKHGYILSGTVLFSLLKCEEQLLKIRAAIQ